MYDSLFSYKAGGEESPVAHPGSGIGETSKQQGSELPREAGLLPFAYQEHGIAPHSGQYEGDTDKSVGNIHIPA
ncbi:MAG: hypothetical protein ACREYF_27425 [Gammaproteobacteria bacterium]